MDGLIYKTLDYKEKSKLVYLYTKEGLDSFLASRAKDYKKGLLGISEITYIRYEARGSNLKYLSEFEILNSFSNIKNSLSLLAMAEIILELARQSNDERYERIFNFTLNSLLELEKNESSYQCFFSYLVKMLKVFGILDLEFKGFSNSLRVKAVKAYSNELTSDDLIIKDDILEVLNYYEREDIVYFKNIKKVMRFIWTRKDYTQV